MQICITELLRLHESAINTCHRFGRILNVYNVKICNISTELLGFLFTEIHNRQQYAYKLNISCGYVLANKETGELFYYGPSQNNQLVSRLVVIVTFFLEAPIRGGTWPIYKNTNIYYKYYWFTKYT